MQLPGPGVFGPPRDHDQALAVLRRAIELGINHIDTAQFYGPDVANELIREALHPYPANLALVSKVGGAARRHRARGCRPMNPTTLREDIEDQPAHARGRPAGRGQPACDGPRIDDPSKPATVNRELFDRQLSAMIQARDEGLIAGIGLEQHLARAPADRVGPHRDRLRAERIQPRRPHLTAGARRLHRTRHRVRAVLPARLGFHRRQSRARPPRGAERGRRNSAARRRRSRSRGHSRWRPTCC